MTLRQDSDGLSQLTELMRDERIPEREPVDPEVRRSARRRRLIVSGIVAVFVIVFVSSYVGYTLSAPLPTAESATEVPEVQVPAAAELALSPEGSSAISVAGAEEYLGPDAAGIWATSGGDKPRPIASITKLITTLVILDAKPLKNADDPGPTITFSKADHALYDKYYVQNATIAAMPTGSSLSLHDALETMLVASACNYAEAVAGWAFGSQWGFVQATKKWLSEHGLTHTTIVEPTGLDPRNVSSPSDLIALARIAVQNPAVVQIAAMKTLQVPGIDPVTNTNDLLGWNGIDGLKTGTLDGYGSNLLYTSKLDVGLPEPLSIIGVQLGGYSRSAANAEVDTLLTSIREGFHEVVVAEQSQVVGTYTTVWGEKARMVIGQNATLLTWSDTPVTSTIDVTTVTTGHDGDQIGTVTYTAGTATATVPVLLEGGISAPDSWWRLTHPSELG